MRIAAAILSFLAALALPAAAPAQARRPVVDWTRTIVAMPSGGFRMGNPNARAKLVEYGSMTCPHCQAFDAEGADPLIANYVKTGRVSFEFRNYIRDPFDLTASLIARCNGARSFFPLTRALFKDQPDWIATIEGIPGEQLQALEKLPPERLFVELGGLSGLTKWAAAHGVAPARAGQCLANRREIDRLVRITNRANQAYPDFAGTPTFLLDGHLLRRTATWDALEPQLRKALGGRG